MSDQTIVNYDELQRFANHFDSESEVIAETQSKLRQQAHELETEWVGKGSEKFFNEFETEILPAMGRLHNALTLSADALRKIMKIFDEAENETTGYFKGSNFDTGLRAAGLGNIGVAAVGGRQFRTPQQGGTAQGATDGSAGGSAGIDVSNLDFGMDGVEINEPGGVPTGDSGEIKAETPAFEQAEAFEEMEPTENTEAAAAGGGGGGGSGGSQGIQGDLKMGVGSSNQSSAAQSGGIGGGAQPMADHIYGGGSTGGMQTPETASAQASAGTPDANTTDAGEIAGAAGVIGGAGAAGAAAKKMKNKNDDE